MRLKHLCEGLLDVPARYGDLEVCGMACDSRKVRPGDLFVAVSGELVDGHRFVRQAVRAGAVAVVGERKLSGDAPSQRDGVPFLRADSSRLALARLCDVFYGGPSRKLEVIGVTGTKGKTTTTWLLEKILCHAGERPALVGTVENRIASRVIPSVNTTPGALDLQTWLREHLDTGGTHAVLEVSSHAIAQSRIDGVRFRCGIFTNISPEHLDYHKTFENYLETKMRLFTSLGPEAFAILCRDDKSSQLIAQRTPAHIVWYGGDSQDGVEMLRISHEGLDFVWKGLPIHSRLLGYHNLLNVLAAMTAAECLGIEREKIAEGIEAAAAPPGRLEDVAAGRPFRVVVDYAHTDGSLDAVLKALRPVTPGRLITVFGCGGDRDRTKRPRMGRVAERGSDHLIITSDNPRGESPRAILEEICVGLERPADAELIEDRREAIGLAIRMARRGDTVLLAGKGHETYQEFRDHTIHFDDREVAREFLQEPIVGIAP